MMTTFEVVEPGTGDRAARVGGATAPAVVRGERVNVPLDAVTPAEAERTRALLAAQASSPGEVAPAPTQPLQLDASSRSYLCRLPDRT